MSASAKGVHIGTLPIWPGISNARHCEESVIELRILSRDEDS